MDRNPMLQNLMNPTPGMGIIPGKCMLDWTIVQEHMKNAEDPAIARSCYPGGAKDINHDVMFGDFSFGLKCVRNGEVMEGEPNELGIVSLAGLYTEAYHSHRSMEDQWYCNGLAMTECRVSNPLDSTTSDPDHGYATARAGTVNTNNNGPYMFYPGMLGCWRFPMSRMATYHNVPDFDSTKDFEPINKLARGGTPNTQFKPEIVPFDYTDFATHISGGFATMRHPKTSSMGRGISDMLFRDFFKYSCIEGIPAVSCDQEEASGYKYGKTGIVLAGVEVLIQKGFLQFTKEFADAIAAAKGNNTYVTANAAGPKPVADKPTLATDMIHLANAIGLWSTKEAEQKVIYEMFANMFFSDLGETSFAKTASKEFIANVCDGNDRRKIMLQLDLDNDPKRNYQKLRLHLSKFDEAALVGGWHSKTSKILGRAMNAAAPGDTMHFLLGHFCL